MRAIQAAERGSYEALRVVDIPQPQPHDLLPHSEIHPLEAGHFAWEQAADDYGRLVADWVSGGYRRIAR